MLSLLYRVLTSLAVVHSRLPQVITAISTALAVTTASSMHGSLGSAVAASHASSAASVGGSAMGLIGATQFYAVVSSVSADLDNMYT